MNKKRWFFLAKLAVSVCIVTAIVFKVVHRDGASELGDRLAELSWGWIAVAAAMQLGAIVTSVVRWQRLLVGQGIHAPWRHLFGSFMIGRFFGAFTPGGWTGLNGYRLYDVAKHTGKLARSTAVIGIEMILGQLAFGAVVIAGSLFGLRVLGMEGVLLVDGFFVALITAGVVLLARPGIVRMLAARLPQAMRARVQSLVDAVCAYQGKGGLVLQAALLGMGTHAFNNLIYVATAHALGIQLGVGEVFFVSAMQIFATLLPASVNGIGLREATAVALYTSLGVPDAVAFLIPTVGFAVEMAISSFGGAVFMSRRVGYTVEMRVDDPEREELAAAAIEEVPRERWPRVTRGAALGLGAGLLAGALVGLGEASVVLASAADRSDLGVLAYAALAYSLACGAGGAVFGAGLALSGRWMRRPAERESVAYARICALIVAAGAFALGAFRIRRDVFHEELVWKSAPGLLLLGGCMLAAGLLYLALTALLRWLLARRPASVMLRAWGTPAVLVGALGVLGIVGHVSEPAEAAHIESRPEADPDAGNLLVLVVDTLRADHLPAYGYEAGDTPHLDAFARDAIRFDQAFANASWTRPSFASILTGRFPSSHQTMAKPDALPDEVVTLPEALRQAGYATYGIATNYNVAPFFNFHQGFDVYRYLEPDYVLGADDTASKLLIVQFLRQKIEAARAARGQVDPGTAYQDAEAVNDTILGFLDREPSEPWLIFSGYMDPHDPYYPHPYDGTGYARAAHQQPDPDEAPRLRELYDGEISFWDRHFGALIEALKDRGVYDDLTLVITSDHGEEFMDHGGFWHGTTLYDEQVHIPLFVKLPQNARGGSVMTHWVQSIDLMPTLLEGAGAEIPEGVQGGDLFQGSPAVFAEESHEGNVLEAVRTRSDDGELKLIQANPGNPRGLKPQELYRVDRDPQEQHDRSASHPDDLQLAEKALQEQSDLAETGKARKQEVDLKSEDEAFDRLRALGYAEE